MTTNLEWLCENDRENLAHMIVGNCYNCKFSDSCNEGFCRCDYDWLDAKYKEPDGWDKIEHDAIGLSQVLSESYSCPARVTNEIVNLVLRCEKLAGTK